MYCTHCLKPCDTIIAEVGFTDHWQDRGEIHYTLPILGEESNCCEAETAEAPIVCCACDEPAAFRCTRCEEFYCAECFGGPDHVEAGGRCPGCAIKLARKGIY